MPYRTVLMAVGVEQDDRDIDRGARIAQMLESHLSLLVIGVAPPPPTTPYGIVSNDIWASEMQEGQAAVRARAKAIAARLAGGPSCSVDAQYVDRGSISTLAARHARYADVTLITPQAEGVALQQSWVTNGALFESGRPVVVLPRGECAFPEARRIVIAWDASVEASKAVRDALDFMKRAEKVDAVLIDPVPSFDGHGAEPGADLAAYLGRHGIPVTIHRLPLEGKDVAEVLQRTAGDLEADLIVMGGFGHSRLRQRIFGGTTISTLRHTATPVLMAH